jgi:hypothetical protein
MQFRIFKCNGYILARILVIIFLLNFSLSKRKQMIERAPSEIISAISETITTLETPLRQLVKKELKEQVILSKYLPDSEKNVQFLTLCLYKAKGCKQIELDFLDLLLFTSDGNLNKKFETMQIKLAKRYAISVGNCDSYSKIKPPILLDYYSIVKFLHRLFNEVKLDADDIVKEKSLDLLTLYLENKASPISDKFSGNLEVLFSYVLILIEGKYSLEAEVLYVKKLASLEKTEFFSQLSIDMKISFYELIYEIDSLVLYRALLENLFLLVEQVFKDDLALIAFIRVLITQFMEQGGVTKNDFDSIIVLVYLALYQKQKMLFVGIDTSNTWLNNLGLMLRDLMADKPSQLSQFNVSYEQKTGTKLAVTIKKFVSGNYQGSRIFYGNAINPKITSWFLLENINRSSSSVKEAFSSVLANSSHYFNSGYENSQDNEAKKGFIKGMALLKTKYSESKEQLKGIVELFSNRAQEKKTCQNFLQTEDSQPVSLTNLQERLQKIVGELNCYTETINSSFNINLEVSSFAFKNSRLNSVVINDSVTSEENYLRLKIELETLEQIARNFISENCSIVLVKSLLNRILAIRKEYFTFQANKLSLLAFIERSFKQGYFFNKQVKLRKLKVRLGKKISFEEERHFFYSQSFFTLLRFGIIRWFWIEKESFAKHWAKQLVLIKVADTIGERNYEQLLKTNVLSRGFASEAELGRELSELYQQVMSAREKSCSIESPFPKLSQDIASLYAKIEKLVAEMASCALQPTEVCSLLEVKSVSANSRKFFDTAKSQIGKVSLLAARSSLGVIN